MGKQTTLAFALALLVIVGYNYFLGQKYPPQPQNAQVVMEEQMVVDTPFESSSPIFVEESASKVEALKSSDDVVVETDLAKIVFTTSGARIKSFQLKDFVETSVTVENLKKQIAQLDASLRSASAEQSPAIFRQKQKLNLLLTRIEQNSQTAELVSLAATMDADLWPSLAIPGNDMLTQKLNSAQFKASQNNLVLFPGNDKGHITFTYSDGLGRRVEKMFTISNSNYIMELEVQLYGFKSNDIPEESLLFYVGPDVGLRLNSQERRMQAYQGPVSFLHNGTQGWVETEKYSKAEKGEIVTRVHDQGKVVWAGLENKYFLSSLIPSQHAENVIVVKNEFGEHKSALTLNRSNNDTYKFRIYLGPKREKELSVANVNLEKSINYGFFSPIAKIIYKVLIFFSSWTHNFGWAIVLLCIITKVIFYPLTHKSFESMQKMQVQMKTIQPEMDELKKKYKDNPQKMNKEVMELYKKKGVNPLASCQSGCLPLLLQMPVFFALYAVLYNSIELRATAFLWVSDLSAKDPIYVLPVLMGVSMFFQQKLTGMGGSTGAQQDQAKMMAIMMPIFLTWIFASLPAGVVLYWFTFNTATALQQLIIKKKTQAVAIV